MRARRPMMRRPLLAAALCAFAAALPAASITSVDVSEEGGIYRMHSSVHFSAPAWALFDVLTDYNHYDQISDVYRESRELPAAPDGSRRVYTRMAGCVLFVCRSIRRTEVLETTPDRYIETRAIPKQSDLRYGKAEWRFYPDATGTRVDYDMELEPDFWVPPLIGPAVLKHKLEKKGKQAVNRIERLARQRVEAAAGRS